MVAKPKRNKASSLIGFYPRKFLFFAFILLAISVVGIYLNDNQLKADENANVASSIPSTGIYDIVLDKNGSFSVNGKNVSAKISLMKNYDELRYLVLDSPGKYIDNVNIALTLPEAVSDSTNADLLAIHGVGQTNISKPDSSRILYSIANVSPTGSISIVAQIPKGIINPTLPMIAYSLALQAKNSFWVVLAIALPILTFFAMIIFVIHVRRRQKIDIPDKESQNPPMAIPPAIVGVLYNQRIGPREIAATLIDLALRGDIVILDQDRGFAFGKGRFDQRLLDYEKVLLSKIFTDKSMSSDQDEVNRRINNHFYSKKISLVSSGMYSLSTMLGYFKVNPIKSHARYRLVGLGFFALGLMGFALNLLYFPDPAYVMFLWIGMMVAALVIILVTKYLPIRTVIGQEVMSDWLAFRKFLANPEKIPFSENNQQIFQKFLPYALVMNCETAWAKRFSEHNFLMPDWFLTEKNGLGLEDFCLSLFPIVSYVGRSLAALKEPGFE